MNLTSFYRELGKLRNHNFKAFIEYEHRIRLHKRINGRQYCPITAVCFMKTGKFFSAGCYRGAAIELNISAQDSVDIAKASDQLEPSAGQQLIRRQILKILECKL